MTGETTVANMALSLLGEAVVLPDIAGSDVAQQQARLWMPLERRSLLARYPWPFATRRVVLAEPDGVTRPPWPHVYVVPNDVIRVQGIRVEPEGWGGDARGLWTFEDGGPGAGRYLLARLQPPVEILYTADVEEGKWPPLFVQALAARLAVRLAGPLRRDGIQVRQLEQQAELAEQRAAAAALSETNAIPSSIGTGVQARVGEPIPFAYAWPLR